MLIIGINADCMEQERLGAGALERGASFSGVDHWY